MTPQIAQQLADALAAVLPAAGANALPAAVVAQAEAALAAHQANKRAPGYTVFIREADNTGTTHVTHHEASTKEEAITLALAETREDWDYEEDEPLHVLGVALGDVDILEWNDLG